jgi:uncharacterized protein YlxW (UPF0749 family)
MKEALEDTTNRWKHACTEVAQKMSDIERLSKETDNLEEEVAGAENRRTELEKILAHERKSASESLVAMEHLLESERGRAANLAQNLKQMSR